MHHPHDRFLRARIGVGDDEVGDAPGFRVHAARHVEAGKIETRLGALLRLGRRRRPDQRVLAGDEVFLLVLAPLVDVEQRTNRGRRPLGGNSDRRQCQAAGLADDDLVGCAFDGDVIGVRPDRHALRGIEQAEVDEILPLDEAADRRRRGHHHQCVAGFGIGEPVQQAGIGKADDHVRERRIGDVAGHRQRLWRGLHLVGKGHRPLRAAGAFVGGERVHLRPVEADADRLPLLQRTSG